MTQLRAMALVLGSAGLMACADAKNQPTGADSGAAALSCDNPDKTAIFAIRSLQFARVTDGVAWGFDLDGYDSDIGDADGCGKQDLTDPLGNPGIDNAFAGLVPVLEQTEAAAAEGLVQDSINAGELLLLVEITGLDDWTHDDCVTVDLGPARGTPLIGTDGMLLDGQSFARDTSGEHSVATDATIEDGVLVTEGMGLLLELQVLDAALAIPVTNAVLRMELEPGDPSVDAQFGGGLPVQDVLAVAQDNGVAQSLRDLLASALPAAADLRDETGECNALSAAFEISAAPAHYLPE